MGLRKIEFDKVWRVAFALAIVLLLIIGAFAFQRLFSLADANEQLGETYKAIDEINLLLSNIKDAETGQRGYLLTEDKSYLEPYNSAIQQIPQIEERLQSLTINDAAQRDRINRIKTLSAARILILKETIEAMRAGKREQALNIVSSGEGKRLMDEIRSAFDEIQQAEKEILLAREERVRDVRITSYAVVAAVVILSLILSFVAFLTGEEFERRNNELKERVKEREIAEKAFRESEERFRLALQHSPISVHQTDKEGRYTWIYNPKARINLEDLIGKKDDEYFPPENVADAVELKNRVLTTGVGERKIIRFYFNNNIESYDMIAEPVCDENGGVNGLTVVAINITQLKNIEEALRESEARFRTITDTMPQIVWSTRADGYTDYLNKRWYEYTGMSRDDNDGWNWVDYLHPDDAERAKNTWKRAVETGEQYEIEYRFRNSKDGTYRWFIGRALPIKDEQGNITRWFGSSTDVDDQKRMIQEREDLLESERAARTEAERAVRLKDEFVATLSHELRSPLNAIVGWSHVLKGGRVDKEIIEKGLDIIERNTKLQAQLISDLLDMNRIISGKLRLNVSQVDLGDVIENSVRSNAHIAEAKRIKIQTLIDSSVSNIMGDVARLEQVIWNLLSNALKFTPKDGQIKIVTKQVDSDVEIVVADDGEGIEPAFLPYVFDRYRQADGSSSRMHGGLGIGLSIVKNLVELHGGTVSVASEGKGMGARFTVKLPIAPIILSKNVKDAGKNSYDILPEQTLRGVRILIVDDELDSRELVKRILEDCEAQVTAALSADEALEIYKHENPDIILSDIGMPGKDGYQLIRELRGLEGGKRTPAVALTAFARLEDKTRTLVEGYNAHITKPVEAAELIATLASLINLKDN